MNRADNASVFVLARAVARASTEYRIAQPKTPIRRLSCAPVLVPYAHMPVEPDRRDGEDDKTPRPETPPPPVREPQDEPPLQAQFRLQPA